MSSNSGLVGQSIGASKRDLLTAEEPAAATILNSDDTRPILFVCDHASNLIPERLHQLGLSEELLDQHIAWDKGTRELGYALSDRLALHTVMCNYSRLVVDCNRQTYDETLICAISDKTIIPGNQQVSADNRHARLNEIYFPYHRAVSHALDSMSNKQVNPAIIALHSFTPQLKGQSARPWDIGFLWDKDTRLAEYFVDYFTSIDDLCVGENKPYSGKDLADFTIDHHGEGRGLACMSIEIRQDLLSDKKDVSVWVEHIANVVEQILSDNQVFDVPD